jgi:hypothetical protein
MPSLANLSMRVVEVPRKGPPMFGIYPGRGRRLGLKCLLLSYFRVGDKNEAAGAAIAAAVAGEEF